MINKAHISAFLVVNNLPLKIIQKIEEKTKFSCRYQGGVAYLMISSAVLRIAELIYDIISGVTEG